MMESLIEPLMVLDLGYYLAERGIDRVRCGNGCVDIVVNRLAGYYIIVNGTKEN